MKIQTVPCVTYITKDYVDCLNKYTQYRFSMRKNKMPFNPNYPRLMSTEAVEITIEESDKAELLKSISNHAGKGYSVWLDAVLAVILDDNDWHKHYALAEDYRPTVWQDGVPGFYSSDRSSGSNRTADNFTIRVVKIADLKEVPLTKKEKEKRELESQRSRSRTLNAATIKDTLLTILNEREYVVQDTGDGTIGFTKIKGYNKLMKEALEHYLNDVVFKDLKIKVEVPKVKNTHKFGFNDTFIDLGDVAIQSE